MLPTHPDNYKNFRKFWAPIADAILCAVPLESDFKSNDLFGIISLTAKTKKTWRMVAISVQSISGPHKSHSLSRLFFSLKHYWVKQRVHL